MLIKERKVEHLTLQSVEPGRTTEQRPASVLILGNAYGVMPYQVPLAEALAARGLEPWWFSFSGQPGTEGSYATASILRDFSLALDFLETERAGEPVLLLAHCMGGLVALEYLRLHPEKLSRVKRMIIYGLLFDPARRWRHALPRLKKSGVNVGLTKAETNYSPLPALSSLNVPLLLCQAKDKLNLRRANEAELAIAAEAAPQAEIRWFAKGYDRDLEPLPHFVECYYSWLTAAETAYR